VLIVVTPAVRYLAGELYMNGIYPVVPPLRSDEVYPDFPRAMFVYMFSPSHFDAFAVGALLATLPRDWHRRYGHLYTRLAGAAFALTVGLGVIAAVFWGSSRYGVYGNFLHIHMRYSHQYVWGYTLINAMSGALILALTRPGWLARALCVRPLAYLGRISFGFYVLHVPQRQVLRGCLPGLDPWSVAFFAVWFGVSLVVSAASYHWFEAFFLARKDYFERRRAHRSGVDGERP
jgi:peptidoglycan/LPS O-acetylase OafA/YrhL